MRHHERQSLAGWVWGAFAVAVIILVLLVAPTRHGLLLSLGIGMGLVIWLTIILSAITAGTSALALDLARRSTERFYRPGAATKSRPLGFLLVPVMFGIGVWLTP